MKIVVTGGAGFIGSHIVDAYIAEGHQVYVIDDLSSGDRRNLNPKAVFHSMDILDPGLHPLLDDISPDVVNHHALQMDVRRLDSPRAREKLGWSPRTTLGQGLGETIEYYRRSNTE